MSYSFSKGGTHALKLGSEYLHQANSINWCTSCNGFIDATLGPRPANLEALFPSLLDPSTWNLAALSPHHATVRQGVGNATGNIPMHKIAAWLQEDWTITRRLTLNLGVRYDVEIGAYANSYGVAVAPGSSRSCRPIVPTTRTILSPGWVLPSPRMIGR